MEIDLTKLDNHILSTLDINGDVNIPHEYLNTTEIRNLKNVKFLGTLENIGEELTLKGILSGTMVLDDSISLDEIDYNFSIDIDEEIEEKLENSSNILDITDVLWQNILLEVPLKLTNVKNFNEYHGDGWKLISEDSIESTNNPFKELEEILREE